MEEGSQCMASIRRAGASIGWSVAAHGASMARSAMDWIAKMTVSVESILVAMAQRAERVQCLHVNLY